MTQTAPMDATDEVVVEIDENENRGNWSGKCDFFLSCVGYAVGLGNVWRFPYLCYKNGGGAFLIPYTLMLALAGLPIFFFELSFGQFANLGPVTIWRVSPLFKGIGWCMIVISLLVGIYYNVIIAWSLRYLFASFTSKLPWMDCENEWNDHRCRNKKFNDTLGNGTFLYRNTQYMACVALNNSNDQNGCVTFQTPAEQYWEREVLGVTNATGFTRTLDSSIGNVKWDMALCLLLAWIIVCLCLIKGVKSSGKVVYFTATFPYVVLIILLINGAMLPGAYKGIEFYMKPKLDQLKSAKVWGEAACQIFYSLGVGFGGLCSMASYNRFKNNCYRDAILVSVINCGTSVFAGFAIFSVIGYMSYIKGLDIEDVAKSGPGLAFIVYPEGIATMKGSVFFSILFFVMLLTLGLDSQFGMMEALFTGVSDEMPWVTNTFKRKACFISISCIICFLLGLPLICQSGIYLFTLMDNYSASYSLMTVVFSEIVVISYAYGIKRFLRDIRMMLGFTPNYYWIVCWCAVTPLIILGVFIFSCIQYQPASYEKYHLPSWSQAIGWLMVLAGILPIPLYFFYYLAKHRFSRETLDPKLEWGPCIRKYWKEDHYYATKLILLEERETMKERERVIDGKPMELFVRF